MAAKIKVYIVALDHDNGTRVMVDGYELDEDVVKDVFSAGDDIVRLKDYIIKEILKEDRSRGQIRLYTLPLIQFHSGNLVNPKMNSTTNRSMVTLTWGRGWVSSLFLKFGTASTLANLTASTIARN